MDLTAALRAFARTVERGSITAAARDLSLSQPAVSKHIANLERRVRARLLERSARLIRPTPEGQALYDASRSALASIDAAVEGVGAIAGTMEGAIRLHAPSCIGGKHLHGLVLDFRRIHPGITFELVTENRTVDLIYENFDLAFVQERPGAQDLIIRRLGLARRILVASPAYLAEHGPVDTLERLAEVPLVTTSRSLTTKNHLSLVRGETVVELEVHAILQSNDAQIVARTLLGGHAAGPVQFLMVADDIQAGRLVRILPEWEARPSELFVSYPSVRYMRPAVRAFADFAVERLRAVEGIDKS